MGSLCGVSLWRSDAGELAADEWTAPAGMMLSLFFLSAALAPEEATNTERGDTGSLGGVEGGDDGDDGDDEDDDDGDAEAGAGQEGDGATCLAGVAGADWTARAAVVAAAANREASIAAPSAASSPAPGERLARLTSAILAIARARLGVVVEDAETEAAAVCAAFFSAAAAAAAAPFAFLPFFIPPAPLSAPSGPKNLA